MTRYLSLLFVLLSTSLFAQDEPGTQAGTINDCVTCNLVGGNLSTATQSAIPFCAGVPGNDVFYTFTSPGPLQALDQVGIKVTIANATFDAAIEIIDNSNASIACSDETAGAGSENLVHYGFTNGATYHVRVYAVDGVIGAGTFDICIQQIPELFVRNNYVGFGLSGDGYTINEFVVREVISNPSPIERTGWLFVCDQDGTEIYKEVNGTSANVNLNSVPGICYNKTFTVYIRIMIGGQWCGYGQGRQIIMEPAPRSVVQSIYCGVTYQVGSGILVATNFGTNAMTEWEFSTDAGNTVFTAMSDPGTAAIFLEDLPQLRYNKLYQVRVRANVCGIWGPWSDPCPIFTENLPYTQLFNIFCGNTYPLNYNYFCEEVQNADTYVWQFAPIECDDPAMEPTGPNQTYFVTGGSTSFNWNLLDITPGQCYRVGVKAFVDIQQGDYGEYCQVRAAGGVAPPPPSSVMSTNIAEPGAEPSMSIYPNPSLDGMFMIGFENVGMNEDLMVEIYSITGARVFEQSFNLNMGNHMMMTAGQDLPKGTYLLKVTDPNSMTVMTERLILR